MIRIEVKGLNQIVSALSTGIGDLTPGFEKAGAIVEAGWKRRVHTVTRKYHDSIHHKVRGMSVRIGPSPEYDHPRPYTRGQTGAWKKPRDGVNTGDPRVYAEYEDQGNRYRKGHPAAEPALRENLDEVVDAIVSGITSALERNLP